MDRTWLKQRIDATKAMIVAYETAIDALGAAGGVQSYTLDTGQSRQTVTRADISSLNASLNSMYNRLATLEARLRGAAIIARPHW